MAPGVGMSCSSRFALASYMLRAFLLPLGHSVPQRTISRTIFGDVWKTYAEFFVVLICPFGPFAGRLCLH